MSSSSVPEVPSSRNAATLMAGVLAPSLAAPSFDEAYALAVAADRLRPPLSAPGHRLYWMWRGGFGSCELRAGATTFVVVGRHTHCDVSLPHDPTVSLRHVLVGSSTLDDGCPLLSVLDLQTDFGFEVEGEPCARAITATGALALRVGGYVLVALPNGGAPPRLPPAIVRQGHPYRDQRAEQSVSRVTLFPRAVHVSERPETLAQISQGPRWEVLLLSPRGHARAHVWGDDLDRGVLIGRAARCVDGGMRSLLDMNISRVHALLLRGPRGLVVYDTASTQGMYTGTQRVRAIPVGAAGADVWLGNSGVRMVLLARAT